MKLSVKSTRKDLFKEVEKLAKEKMSGNVLYASKQKECNKLRDDKHQLTVALAKMKHYSDMLLEEIDAHRKVFRREQLSDTVVAIAISKETVDKVYNAEHNFTECV